MPYQRIYPIGAEVTEGGAYFKVWAPSAKIVQVIFNKSQIFEMNAEPGGYQSLFIPSAAMGDLYQFKLDDDEFLYPDPASRAQPFGPHGPSMLIAPQQFCWSDESWKGATSRCNIIYEMHIGTFTQHGTFLAALDELPELAQLGVTIIELMPVNEFDGEFGWGYDGVDLFAPFHGYGAPDDLRLFIDKAHSLGLAVILDVVYNHVGSSGCYFSRFSSDYFSNHHKTEWGAALNFDGQHSFHVREFIINNAIYWIQEFHFDGFRFDATQQIFDNSKDHIIACIVRHVRSAAPHRHIYIAGENEPQNINLVDNADEQGNLDALWNDDFHRSAMVVATGRNAAYFSDYTGNPQEFISCLKYGFLYQGQYYLWQQQARGTPALNVAAEKFIHYLQNHDQIANSGLGKRLHQLTHPALLRVLTSILLLGPQTPLLFQGQEFGASTPFLYFADNPEFMIEMVAHGRNEFLRQFPALAQPEMQPYLSRPEADSTFTLCKLKLSEREKNSEIYALHKDLLKLRTTDNVFSGKDYSHIDGALVTSDIVIMRFFSTQKDDDRLLIINFGCDKKLLPIPEPLFSPHVNKTWKLHWSSESPLYGGHGSAEEFTQSGWLVPGLGSTVLIPVPTSPGDIS